MDTTHTVNPTSNYVNEYTENQNRAQHAGAKVQLQVLLSKAKEQGTTTSKVFWWATCFLWYKFPF